MCDVLYGKGIRCGGTLKSAMQQHVDELKAAWKSLETSTPSIPSRKIFLFQFIVPSIVTTIMGAHAVLYPGG